MQKKQYLSTIGLITFLIAPAMSHAAQPINLSNQKINILQTLAPSSMRSLSSHAMQSDIKELSSEQDRKGTTHIRIKQYYQGIPVWNGDAIVHIPAGGATHLDALLVSRKSQGVTMNGIFYQGLSDDLSTLTSTTFTEAKQKKILKYAIQHFSSKNRLSAKPTDQAVEPIIYTDKQNKAHPAFFVSFLIENNEIIPKKPSYLIDADTLQIYKEWDDVKKLTAVKGGGIGGNEGLVGKITYDGAPGHFPILSIERNDATKMCYLQNAQLTVIDKRNNKTPQFRCTAPSKEHNNVFWNDTNDYANGGYSPNNDAIYSDYIVRKMYLDWFDVVMLRKNPDNKNDHTPWKIKMITHDPREGQNAWWSNGTMAFGEGDNESYPVVAPSVVAHELGHGFTEQQSNLRYYEQSGGLNESFSDMADKAIEYYVYGKNTWTIDPELLKVGGRLLRYMDDPTQDCEDGQKPGHGCSIASFKDYTDEVNVHHSSGIFNHAFYLLANKWDTKKAFAVMVHANRFYWTPNSTFQDAACGVLHATKYYQYDLESVRAVMQKVDVDTSTCNI